MIGACRDLIHRRGGGTSGDLGHRITTALTTRGAAVRALVRPDASAADRDGLVALGTTVAEADASDVDAVATACAGADCVVSALNGLREVVLDRQSVLLDAAVRASAPWFVPPDYSADPLRTTPDRNRNFDLRREFAGRADRAPMRVTSVLDGAFMELLDGDMPVIQPRIRRVLCWGGAKQLLDFTTRDEVAAYTAAAAVRRHDPAGAARRRCLGERPGDRGGGVGGDRSGLPSAAGRWHRSAGRDGPGGPDRRAAER